MTDRNAKSSMGNVSQNALDKILQGEVKQTPGWYFVLKNVVLWFVGGLCIVAGALTVSLVIFTFANSALFIHNTPQISFLRHLTIVSPLFWIVLAIVFVVLFDILVRCTEQGYRYSVVILLIINFVLSIVIGMIFYSCGISHVVDDLLGRFQYYHNVENRQSRIFDTPDKGVVVGRVIGCGDEYFTLVTPRGYKWHVMYENVSEFESNDIIDGQILMISGKKIDEGIFAACEIHKRDMRGESLSVRNKHMEKIQKVHSGKAQMCTCEKMSNAVRQMVKTACVQGQ